MTSKPLFKSTRISHNYVTEETGSTRYKMGDAKKEKKIMGYYANYGF